MPPEEAFDPVTWVQQLDAWLRDSLDTLRQHDAHLTLVDIAEAQFRLGVATLSAALIGGAVEPESK
jgi:hypothetical protein